MPSRQILEDLEVGAALGQGRAYHWADIRACDSGAPLGRLRYGWRVLSPMPEAVRWYKHTQRAEQQPGSPYETAAAAAGSRGGPATVLEAAAAEADADPARAARLRVTLHACQGLLSAAQPSSGGSGARGQQVAERVLRPYCRYEPPGRPGCACNSACGEGSSPAFGEAAEWGLVHSEEVEAALEGSELQVCGMHWSPAGSQPGGAGRLGGRVACQGRNSALDGQPRTYRPPTPTSRRKRDSPWCTPPQLPRKARKS
jgi:hypothetical protein